MNSKQPFCPESIRLASVSEESNKLGDFLEWLQSQEVTFCSWNNKLEMYQVHPLERLSINQILAQYYEIDLEKVELERREILRWLREVNK
ncbi:hypothetical protein KW795_03000 [Candidatus Microgenomates bacterium]|nr:hypothetical protein [Candidatus Microgenomates bacterium]